MTDATKEACQLSAFIRHLQIWQTDHPDQDPFVLIQIGGAWLPVRAGVSETGEHDNAVAIECLEDK